MAIDAKKIEALLMLPSTNDVERQLGECLGNVEVSDLDALKELLPLAKGTAHDLLEKIIQTLEALLAKNDLKPRRWVWHPEVRRPGMPPRTIKGHWTYE